ncbi:MAG: phosphatidylglycerol lysyltransferase domain-containing protein [Eubacteriales bacterium]|nr:phosphatidylglycerol lysyltransferase domain-containing protein [Eubacteriales bacterium]
MEWKSPELNMPMTLTSDGIGSDSLKANIYLLRDKYNTQVAYENGVLFRRYEGERESRRGYGFPLSMEPFDLVFAVNMLKDDAAARGERLRFCLLTDDQRDAIDEAIRKSMKGSDLAGYIIDWQCDEDDSDYIYLREKLALLPGRKFQKKRNHINHFYKRYPDAIYVPITDENEGDAIEVTRQWQEAKSADGFNIEPEELDRIREAFEKEDELHLMGGILYAGGNPVAMTIAAAINERAVDVIFEKAIYEYALDGAFSVINNCFAASEKAAAFTYINREEDMGVEGLRKAKESYRPEFKLSKYYGEINA